MALHLIARQERLVIAISSLLAAELLFTLHSVAENHGTLCPWRWMTGGEGLV